MGYTHYFASTREISEDEWEDFITFTRKAIRLSHTKIRGGDGEGPPEIDQDRVVFNGDESVGGAAETFFVSRLDTNEYCKTYQRAYDIVVSACLTYLARHCDYDVGSDGFGSDFDYFEDEWAEGMALCDLTEERLLADKKRAHGQYVLAGMARAKTLATDAANKAGEVPW